MQEIKAYPEWKQAVDEILSRVQSEGYGILISLQELHDYMDMTQPSTLEDYKKYQFKWLGHVENLKTCLLEEHDICLMNSKGDGYIVCTPDDQVSKAYSKLLKKARAKIIRASQILIHVDQDLLTAEGSRVRLDNMAKVAFISQAMNKRKLPIQEVKAIGASK